MKGSQELEKDLADLRERQQSIKGLIGDLEVERQTLMLEEARGGKPVKAKRRGSKTRVDEIATEISDLADERRGIEYKLTALGMAIEEACQDEAAAVERARAGKRLELAEKIMAASKRADKAIRELHAALTERKSAGVELGIYGGDTRRFVTSHMADVAAHKVSLQDFISIRRWTGVHRYGQKLAELDAGIVAPYLEANKDEAA